MECSTNNDSNSLIDFPESLSAQEVQHFDNILRSIQQCSQEQNIDRKIQILRFINSVLPNEIQLRIPSLITDDYVESALYNLEMACKGRIKLKNYFLFTI
jgi:tRNA isopentenyl-2-thiomethyl-A-37 hydroxylase MiaE